MNGKRDSEREFEVYVPLYFLKFKLNLGWFVFSYRILPGFTQNGSFWLATTLSSEFERNANDEICRINTTCALTIDNTK